MMVGSLLVTGGAGFIGSNLVRHMLRVHESIRVINFDKLTYAGNLENLKDVERDPRYTFVLGDICSREDVESAFRAHGVRAVIHCAAESHVDRSIMGAQVFAQTNVVGTQLLLDASREFGVERFLHVSTDEVYGSLGPTGAFTEETPVSPTSPYAASKAASDLLALASARTHGFPVVVSRCSNNYGPYQFPEKLIPLMIVNAMAGVPLPVYGDGLQIRDWLHVEDHCRALDLILQRGLSGEVYNVGGKNEWTNIDVVREILRLLGKPEDLIRHVVDRPGHDRRYAIDASKFRREMSWEPSVDFARGLARTVEWYRTHEQVWKRVMTGEYREYYQRNYHAR